MASYYGIDAANSSNVFADFAGKTSSSSNMLGDYAMIKNGSYKKLLSSYYNKNSNGGISKEEETKEVAAEKKNLALAKGDADNLMAAAEKLRDTEFIEENRDEITKSIKSFVENYNAMLDSSSEVETKSVLQTAVWMTKLTSSNRNLLGEIGVKIGKDNKLTVDDEVLGKAKMTTLDSLFKGSGSFSNRIVQKASQLGKAAASKALEGRGASAYTNQGDYKNLSSGALFEKLF